MKKENDIFDESADSSENEEISSVKEEINDENVDSSENEDVLSKKENTDVEAKSDNKITIAIIVIIALTLIIIGLIIFLAIKGINKDDKNKNNDSISSSSISAELMEKFSFTGSSVATVNGEDISPKHYAYYFNGYKAQYDNGDENFWTTDKAEVVTAVKTQVETVLKNYKAPFVLAEKLGIKWDSEDDKTMQKQLDDIYATYSSEDAVVKILDEMGTDLDSFKKDIKSSVLLQKVYNHLYGDKGTEKLSESDLLKYYNENNVLVKHILIGFPEANPETPESSMTDEELSSVTADLKKTAEEVLARAKSGEDFESLISKYNDDPGMTKSKDGYFFDKNENFVEEFKTASFALDVDGISDIVETEFGYHIIKRLPINDYFKKNKDDLEKQYYSDIFNDKLQEAIDSVTVTPGEGYDSINAFSFVK